MRAGVFECPVRGHTGDLWQRWTLVSLVFCFSSVVALPPLQILIPNALVRLFRSVAHLLCPLLQSDYVFCVWNALERLVLLSEPINRAILMFVVWSLMLVMCNFYLIFSLPSPLVLCFDQEMMEVSGTLFLLVTETSVVSLSCCHKLYH